MVEIPPGELSAENTFTEKLTGTNAPSYLDYTPHRDEPKDVASVQLLYIL